jgi:hypothetical protein
MVAAQHAAKSSHFCPVQDQPFSHHGLKNGISVRTRAALGPGLIPLLFPIFLFLYFRQLQKRKQPWWAK